jgi:nitroreductase
MQLADVIRTTGAVRTFDPRPVPTGILYRVLDNARFAPSGGNKQPWHVIIVRDRQLRIRLADLSAKAFERYVAEESAGYRGFGVVRPAPRNIETPADLPAHPMLSAITAVPEILVVTADLRELAVLDRDLKRPSIVGGASIYPFVENILLAARNEGLGCVLTTFLAAEEADAAPLLALPPEHAIAALVGLGFPVKQTTRLNRKPVEEFATVDTFLGSRFTDEVESNSQ